MRQAHQYDHDYRFSDARMAALFEAFDDLHTAVSEGDLETITTLNKRELVGWLRELVYTAEETITEIEKNATYPALQLVK